MKTSRRRNQLLTKAEYARYLEAIKKHGIDTQAADINAWEGRAGPDEQSFRYGKMSKRLILSPTEKPPAGQ